MSDAQAEPREAPAQEKPAPRNMSRRTAQMIVIAIIALCLLALVFIFQPVYRPLFSAGCVMVVAGGLLFNLIPFANTQNPVRRVVRVTAIVGAILIMAVFIALGFVEILL
ncbi:MAG: hypothetical protein OXO52_01855 [Rhodospirillales bacterium]|nr:hypothetical protein [Rhodospirillales bacterium]